MHFTGFRINKYFLSSKTTPKEVYSGIEFGHKYMSPESQILAWGICYHESSLVHENVSYDSDPSL